jgi:hypothetical protein
MNSSGGSAIIFNGPEIGSSSSNPYIIVSGNPPVPGIVVGKDSATGNLIVLVAVTSLGAC